MFVIRESLSVSLVFVGWKIGLVFRLSDGTQVWCPVVDLVPRCCSSAEHDRGREGVEYQKQKKVVGSGVVVLAHARYEGQGSLQNACYTDSNSCMMIKWEGKSCLCLSKKRIRSLRPWTSPIFPLYIIRSPDSQSELRVSLSFPANSSSRNRRLEQK